jgi:hypothetical protein
VAPSDPEATAAALFDLASTYDTFWNQFSANAVALRERHAQAGQALLDLVTEALPDRMRSELTSRVH